MRRVPFLPVAARVLAIALGLAACSAPIPLRGRGDRVFEISQQHALDPAFARGGDALLAGFPTRLADRGPVPGDRLLFGFESFSGDTVTRRYVLFEAEPGDNRGSSTLYLTAGEAIQGLPTTRLSIRVRTFDEQLRPIGDARNEVTAILFELGLFPWARASDGSRFRGPLQFLASSHQLPPTGMEDWRYGWSAAYMLFGYLLENPALVGLVADLSVWPTFLEKLSLLGAKLELETGLRLPRLVPQPIPDLPAGDLAYETQFLLSRGSEPVLVVYANLVPAAGPLGLNAGIVTMAGYRGTDPERRFVARLLAAHQE
ncbi:MAG: hypothetical protein U1E73_12175 [Planctomycetota bacterium]